ncbi:MAG: hypothetical protein QHC90_07775 [Shinella sp.]|jgi:hypothetical protein|nr:hypothetical protein [Shinella sp.]
MADATGSGLLLRIGVVVATRRLVRLSAPHVKSRDFDAVITNP